MQSSFVKGKIIASIGGSVAHLARAAVELPIYCKALCCVGDDYVGNLLEKFVLDHYDESIILKKHSESASVIPILYRETAREIIGPRVSANDLLLPVDIEQPNVRSLLSKSDIVIVDGYTAVEDLGREACVSALAFAKSEGACTVFDVVPHHCYAHYSLEALIQLTEHADIIVVEVRTLAKFCNLDFHADPETVVTIFKEIFPKSLGILRYGEVNIRINRFVSANCDTVFESQEPLSQLVSAGYGDKLTLMQVFDLYEFPEKLGIQRNTLPWNLCTN